MATDPEKEMDDLLRRLSTGEPEAVARFLERYQRQILRHIELNLRSRGKLCARGAQNGFDAQSVFISTVRSFLDRLKQGGLRFDDPNKVIAYLKTTSSHKILTRLRAPSQHKSLDAAESIADPSPSPVDLLANNSLKDRLLDGIDPVDRTILQLRAEGFTIREIAEAVNMTPATVHRRLQKVINRLRDQNDGEQ
jgi:RNA polymerase sigma factor (sigma-70 family)